ncbi:MAG: hypothetical protein BWX74_00685 [Tenericutes bacterium ADurb.Bin087]|nr:MAG: hypothetical protein BWX74_00685 [Tenericutes bacterium ADurb.Bin087]
MKGLFKRLGQGLLFILALPFGLIIFAIFAVYAIMMFFYTLFSAIPAFFKGENVFGPTELDIAASTRLAEQKLAAQQPPPPPVVQPSTTINLFTVQQPGSEQVPPQVTYTQGDGVTYRRVTEQEVAKLPEEAIIDHKEDQE